MSSTTNTWAEIAKQPVAAQKLFGQTECTVSLDKYIPKVKTPPPAGKYPVFKKNKLCLHSILHKYYLTALHNV